MFVTAAPATARALRHDALRPLLDEQRLGQPDSDRIIVRGVAIMIMRTRV